MHLLFVPSATQALESFNCGELPGMFSLLLMSFFFFFSPPGWMHDSRRENIKNEHLFFFSPPPVFCCYSTQMVDSETHISQKAVMVLKNIEMTDQDK